MGNSWGIEEGKIDAAEFFAALPRCFPDATTLFVEGTSIDEDVKNCLSRHAEIGKHLPGRQTLWPTSALYRCKFSKALCAEMSQLSNRLARAELCDHLSLYREQDVLLEFHDFGANHIYISGAVPEAAVSSLASAIRLKYYGVDAG